MSDSDTEYYLPEDGPKGRGSSYYGTFRKCMHRGYLRYILGALPDSVAAAAASTPGARRGTLAHRGLMAYYLRLQARQQKRDPNVYPPPGVAMRERAAEGGKLFQDELPAALAAVDGYLLEIAARDRVRVVMVEQVISAIVGHTSSGAEVVYEPRIDLALMDMDGLLLGPDHKTTTRPGRNSYRDFERDRQFIGLDYLLDRLATEGGIPGCTGYGGILVNSLSCVPPYKPDRITLNVGDTARAEFAASLVLLAEEIEQRQKMQETLGELAWPKLDSANGCIGKYNDRCEFWNRCTGRRKE